MVTTTVAPTPPVLGRSSLVIDSMSWVNAIPCRTGVGRSGSIPQLLLESTGPPVSPVADRAGEEIARIIFESICPCSAGIRNRPWVVPSSSSHIVNRGPLQRPGFLGLQLLALEALRQVGGDHLEQVPAQHPQRLGVVVRGQRHQVRLGGGALLGGDRELTGLRQPAQRRDDHPRLGDVHPTLRPSPPTGSRGASSFSASFRSDRASRRTCRVSIASQSAAVAAPERDGGLGAFGMREDPQLQRRQLRLVLGDPHQHRPGLVRRHRQQRHTGHRTQVAAHPFDDPHHRVLGGRSAGCSWVDPSTDH